MRKKLGRRLVLWGFHPGYASVPIKLSAYTKAEAARRKAQGFIVAACRSGQFPQGSPRR